MPMTRHLLYLQEMHFLLATLMSQAPALSLHLATSPSLSSQSFSSQPSDVTVSLGSHLTLPCVVAGRRGEVQVSRDLEIVEF